MEGAGFGAGESAAPGSPLELHHVCYALAKVCRITWTSAFGEPESWGYEIAQQPLAPNAPARFRAPVTNWYRVQLSLRGVADDISVCAKLERPSDGRAPQRVSAEPSAS